MNQNNSQNNSQNKMNKQNQSNQKNKQNDINYKVVKNQSAMDLENLNLEYKSQLTAYRQAVSNYVSFLQNNKGLTYLIIGLKNAKLKSFA